MSVEVIKEAQLSEHFGKEIHRIKLKNQNDISVELLTLGGTLLSIVTPDRTGKLENILLTYDHIEDYIENPYYLNASIGLTAGRIRDGAFIMDDISYKVPVNNDINCLHGGPNGLHAKIWKLESFRATCEFEEVILKTHHCHLEDGFPGNINIRAIYRLSNEDTLKIIYEAETDRSCTLNLTNHNYYNLSGAVLDEIGQHELFVNAEYYKAIDAHGLPIEDLVSCLDSDFDFTHSATLEKALEKGLDHPFCIEFKVDEEMPDVVYKDPKSGRVMSITTNQEAVVIYSNNGPYRTHKAICFETQGYPNQIYVLDADEAYLNETSIAFGVEA
ncbi:aldose epimerase family protein [Fusibacter sp. 3D3]|uniref:aldose epimerase family protein n=1 Tax=Fusibacter sp. 3D3 TaxID=1048380 RepID=UPI00085327B1|nr:aldose epimerase family protein [Fusibacter sp. 3D3]GAU75515.1 aldose 1-epimerase [Fusibacter sp. 3D3]